MLASHEALASAALTVVSCPKNVRRLEIMSKVYLAPFWQSMPQLPLFRDLL
jgi:hypothetical protein